jgi:riboflavin synthase
VLSIIQRSLLVADLSPVELLAPIIDIQSLDSSKSGGGGYSITIGQCAEILKDCTIGDSICVNGTCLTVTEFDVNEKGGYFKIGAAPETLKKTNLGQLKVGDKVNCERAMQAHTRFGGHFVQGHVDTTAMLQSVVPTGNALTLTLRLTYTPDSLPLPSSLSPYLIAKGYVTLDGASLTLIDVSPATGGRISTNKDEKKDSRPPSEIVEFSIMLIKHTQEVIGLSAKKAGDLVNIELDVSAFTFQ